MADAYIGSSVTTVPLPLNYVHKPEKFENRTRALDGSMLINYAVTTGNVAVTKYHFELPGITQDERLAVREEALKTGNITYIDHITIPEVLTCTGSTERITMNLLRGLSSTETSDITSVTLNSSGQAITITTSTTPPSDEVYITTTGRMTFGPGTTAGTNNLIVNYIPAYPVHIISDDHTLMQKSSTGAHIVRYNLVLEEV